MIENSIVYRKIGVKYEYLALSKAEGSFVWDKSGKRYIDFTSVWNVTNLGWNNPEVTEALVEQTKKNTQGLLWGSDPIQEEYARALTDTLPKELDACIKETGGTESVEVSIKVARAYTGRKKIIGFRNSYHGQLFASLALGNPAGSLKKIEPLVPEIISLEFPHESVGKDGFEQFVNDFETVLSRRDVAAVVTEPGIITGWGSTLVAFPEFLSEVRRLTEKYGTLLIVDEVGTGFSRTGKLFGVEHEKVVPDMIVLAKAISNGAAAIGTVVGKSALFEQALNDAVLVSTFGWTPLACAAALKTLQIHKRDKVWEMAKVKGNYIMEVLKKNIGGKVIAVRGKGMEIGLEFTDAKTCEEVRRKAFANGLHIVTGSQNNMQLMPPLTIPQETLEQGLDILVRGIQE
ncbi:MAG: putrescine aminotransferase [Parcubacteria group bacterium Gr01-1014_30]|nr:MAG: putrescine aminotransferase [Parcubacteria group bacterium Gr01-1014_30]